MIGKCWSTNSDGRFFGEKKLDLRVGMERGYIDIQEVINKFLSFGKMGFVKK